MTQTSYSLIQELTICESYNIMFSCIVQIKNPHCNINKSSQKCLVYNQRKVHLGVFFICFLVMLGRLFLLIYCNFLLEYSLYSNLNETFTQRIQQHYEYQTHIFKFKKTRKQFSLIIHFHFIIIVHVPMIQYFISTDNL